VRRAAAGDDRALPGLRALLRDPDVWRNASDLTAAARAIWASHLAADGFAAAGDNPGPGAILQLGLLGGALDELGVVLTDYVEACRLHAAYAEGRAARANGSPLQKEMQKRLASADRRLQSARRWLELLRRLL
jgi:hypothetical protein